MLDIEKLIALKKNWDALEGFGSPTLLDTEHFELVRAIPKMLEELQDQRRVIRELKYVLRAELGLEAPKGWSRVTRNGSWSWVWTQTQFNGREFRVEIYRNATEGWDWQAFDGSSEIKDAGTERIHQQEAALPLMNYLLHTRFKYLALNLEKGE